MTQKFCQPALFGDNNNRNYRKLGFFYYYYYYWLLLIHMLLKNVRYAYKTILYVKKNNNETIYHSLK